MSTAEIVLLVIGGLFFVISFFLPDGKKKEEQHVTEEEIRALVEKEMNEAKSRINDMVDETVNYSVEKTERALEKLSNEKIMAVDEYAETVLEKINSNHQEAVFLYDMLNDKDEKLKNSGEELESISGELLAKQEELKQREEDISERERIAKENEAERKRAEEERIRQAQQRRMDEERAARERSKAARANELAALSMLDASEKAASQEQNKEESNFMALNPEKIIIKDGYAMPPSGETEKSDKATKGSRKTKSTKEKTVDKKTENVPSMVLPFDNGHDGMKNSNDIIVRMHNEGKSNMAIARELGLGVGEVKLVIDLFVSKSK